MLQCNTLAAQKCPVQRCQLPRCAWTQWGLRYLGAKNLCGTLDIMGHGKDVGQPCSFLIRISLDIINIPGASSQPHLVKIFRNRIGKTDV